MGNESINCSHAIYGFAVGVERVLLEGMYDMLRLDFDGMVVGCCGLLVVAMLI